MDKILIIGGNGLFGLHLYSFLKKKGKNVSRFIKKKNNNLLDKKKCKFFFFKNKFDVIINLAAITDVDYCEKFKSKALRVNTNLLKNVSFYSRFFNKNTYLIHFSTDQFYSKYFKNNERSGIIKNFYTKTKLLSEKYLKDTNSIILRTNFFGRSLNLKKKKSFSDFIYLNLIKKKQIKLVTDVKFSPLAIDTICKILLLIMKKKICGLYNLGSKKGFSKSTFGNKFAKKLNLDKSLIKCVKLKDLNFYAKRPKDMRMNVSKFEKKFDYKFKTLDYELNSVIKYYEKKL